MKILIFGASGATGQHLVKQALAQGHEVTSFVRDPAKLQISHEKLRVIKGDVQDAEVTRLAIRNQDVVISALGANHPFKFDGILVEGMRSIVESMELEGVSRLIYLSFIGTGAGRHDAGFLIRFIAPKILRSEIAGHQQREKMIRDSRLNWTIVHAPMLNNGPSGKVYRVGLEIQSNRMMNSISRADVADFMLKQIHDQGFSKKTPRIML